MFKKKNKQDDEVFIESEESGDVKVDEPAGEEVPTQELLSDILLRQAAQWRMIAFSAIILTSLAIVSNWYAYSTRYDAPLYVYNQASGTTTVAQPLGYEAEGFLSDITLAVRTLNTWSATTFDDTIRLVEGRFSPDIINAMRLMYSQRKSVWTADGYRQRLDIRKAYWPLGPDGKPLKYVPGMPNIKVRIEADFVREKRDGTEVKKAVVLDVVARRIVPTVEAPHGYQIIRVDRAEGTV